MSGQTFFDKTAFWDEQRFQGLELERARRVVDFLPPDTTSALDVGCGNGLITHLIPKDIPAAGLDLSQAALSHLRVPAVRGSATHLPFGANAFDALICAEMLEHIPFPDFPIALTELARVARRQRHRQSRPGVVPPPSPALPQSQRPGRGRSMDEHPQGHAPPRLDGEPDAVPARRPAG